MDIAPDTPIEEQAAVNKERGHENLWEIRRLTGLGWSTLAELFMVDRRTIYNWSQRGNIAESSKQHLAGVLGVLRAADCGSAEQNIRALYEPGPNGDAFFLLRRRMYAEALATMGRGPGRPKIPDVKPNDRTRPLGIGFFTDHPDD